MAMNRIFISAAHKSSGKTSISVGLCAALARRGLQVSPFKKGPDYIDPMWLARASGRPCHNLDFYTMARDEILGTFHQHTQQSDLALIEGNKGLYDGLDLDGANSNAALAKLLEAPVILVIDTRGMTRGIAPLILGYQAFDRDIYIAGVILNQLGGARHERKLREVVEYYTDIPVVGAVQRDETLQIDERHLGLIPSNESTTVIQNIDHLARTVADQVDLDTVLELAANAPALASMASPSLPVPAKAELRIGVARDPAFGFYYDDDLQALIQAGAELVDINTLFDQKLPDVDALFIGGGFPETHMAQLAANQSLREDIRRAVEAGMPTYAECGGLMYLARSVKWGEEQHPMVGVLPADAVMYKKPQGRGYVRLQANPAHLWPMAAAQTTAELHAHEFHYSRLENIPAELTFAYKVLRGSGVNGQGDGIVYKNLLACYAHMRNTRQTPWVSWFVDFIRTHRTTQQKVECL
jgi:cobyrinic acid a,c-diamide synthase